MIKVSFWVSSSPTNAIYKNKVKVGNDIEGRFIEPFDVVNPTVKIKLDPAFMSVNYCVITGVNRRYFITGITVDNGFMYMKLETDVLETYRNTILAYSGIIGRQENEYAEYIDDNMLSAYQFFNTSYQKFPLNPFDTSPPPTDRNYCLITTSN